MRETLVCMIFMFVLMIGLGSAELVVDGDTIALWHFNEGSGDIINDSSANGNEGTLIGNMTWVGDGMFGNALYFDGVDDRVSVIKTSSVDLTTEVTIEAWVKRDSNENGTIFSRNGPFFMAVRDNKVYGGIHTSGGPEGWTDAQGTTDLQLGIWYHLALTYDGSNVKVFVDGVEEGYSSKIGIMEIRSQQPWIGWGEPGQNQYFKGTIDEVRISNVARTFVPDAAIIPEFSFFIATTTILGALGAFFLIRRSF